MAKSGRIVITGASTGIGRACAVHFAKLGYEVYAGVRKSSDAEALKSEGATPVMLDVTDPKSIAGVAAAVAGVPLAGLINNAGIAVTGPLELVPVDAWRRQFEVNVIGLVAVTQAFLPMLRESKGRIVNIGSIAGRSALPGSGPYDSSKFAVEAVSDALRMELQSSGVLVSLIEPGAVATPIWEKTSTDVAGLRDHPAYAPYAKLMANIEKEAAGAVKKAVPVGAVVKAVEHAIEARRPKTRYVIGSDAWLFLALNLLPDRWRDRLILSQLQK